VSALSKTALSAIFGASLFMIGCAFADDGATLDTFNGPATMACAVGCLLVTVAVVLKLSQTAGYARGAVLRAERLSPIDEQRVVSTSGTYSRRAAPEPIKAQYVDTVDIDLSEDDSGYAWSPGAQVNTDGTPMLGDSGMDCMGKALGESDW
jgi:hypothetical protein